MSFGRDNKVKDKHYRNVYALHSGQGCSLVSGGELKLHDLMWAPH